MRLLDEEREEEDEDDAMDEEDERIEDTEDDEERGGIIPVPHQCPVTAISPDQGVSNGTVMVPEVSELSVARKKMDDAAS